jgi:hypothetical protein
MTCPPDIAAVVLDILQLGIIRIRCFATTKESNKCFIESDHIHNLPTILTDYRPERLRYYWDLERPSFMTHVPDWERRDLEPLWERLGALVIIHNIPPLPDSTPIHQSVTAS